MPCTRATPRSTRSSDALPHSASPWAAADSTTSGTNRIRSIGARTAPDSLRARSEPPTSADWSCQCTRSTRSRALKWRGCSQTREEQTTPSDSASTRTPVATSWWCASWATNCSAVVRTLKVIASTESRGGSKGTWASSSGGGVRAANSERSSPRARRRTAAP